MDMKRRTASRLGRDISEGGFGAWQIGDGWGSVTEADATAALSAALDAGVSLIDTADGYGGGRSPWSGSRPRSRASSTGSLTQLPMVCVRRIFSNVSTS